MANRYPQTIRKQHSQDMVTPQQIPVRGQRPQLPGMWPQQSAQLVQQHGADDKHQEFLKQQQRLKFMASSAQKQPISADALIENLLGKSDTFKPKKVTQPPPGASGTQVVNVVPLLTSPVGVPPQQLSSGDSTGMYPSASHYYQGHQHGPGPVSSSSNIQKPHWMSPRSPSFPLMYHKIWSLVGKSDGLVDTSKIFPILLTSGLSTEVLGYIWSLANCKIPGQLVEEELYIVLALVALAQNNCTFNNLNVLNLIPQPLIPNLNLTRFESTVPTATISTVSAEIDSRMQIQAFSKQPEQIPSFHQESYQQVQDDGFDDFTEFQSAIPAISALQSAVCTSQSAVSASQSCLPKDSHSTEQVSRPNVLPVTSNFSVPPVLESYSSDVVCEGDDRNSSKQKFPSVVIVNSSSRGIGSRLANHSLTAPKANRLRHHRHHHHHRSQVQRNSNFESEANDKKSPLEELEEEGAVERIFPKCHPKPNQGKTFLLKESAIRTTDSGISNPPIFVDSITPNSAGSSPADIGLIPSTTLPTDTSPSVLTTTTVKSSTAANPMPELMSVSEDRYSALRELSSLSFDDSKQPAVSDSNTMLMNPQSSAVPVHDDFGDFVSADVTSESKIKVKPIPSTFAQLSSIESKVNPEQNAEFHVDWDTADFQLNMAENAASKPENNNSAFAGETTEKIEKLDLSDIFMNLHLGNSKNGPEVKQGNAFNGHDSSKKSSSNLLLQNLVLPVTGDPLMFKVDESPEKASYSSSEQAILTADTLVGMSTLVNETVDEVDDFGDFVGSEMWQEDKVEPNKDFSYDDHLHPVTKDTMFYDTQSVSSLELPSLALSRHGSLPSLDLKDLTCTAEKSTPENINQMLELTPQRIEIQVEEWCRCIQSCVNLFKSAAETFNSVSNEEVLSEVLTAVEGKDYLQDLREVAAVCQRVELSSKQINGHYSELESLLNVASSIWDSLQPYYMKANIPVCPEREQDNLSLSVDSSTAACCVCLGYVSSSAPGNMVQLDYGGNIYHAVCANLWVNCVDSSLPSFRSSNSLL